MVPTHKNNRNRIANIKVQVKDNTSLRYYSYQPMSKDSIKMNKMISNKKMKKKMIKKYFNQFDQNCRISPMKMKKKKKLSDGYTH